MNWELQDRRKDKGNWFIRYIKSFKHACSGIWYCILHEQNMKIMFLATITVVALGFIFKLNYQEWLSIVFCCGLVFVTEMINSAIEAAVDLKTLETQPLAKLAKDIASGAVLITVLVSVITAIIIFIPKM